MPRRIGVDDLDQRVALAVVPAEGFRVVAQSRRIGVARALEAIGDDRADVVAALAAELLVANDGLPSRFVLGVTRHENPGFLVERHGNLDRPTAHGAVLDVLLLAGRLVDQHLDRFTAVGAQDALALQHRLRSAAAGA